MTNVKFNIFVFLIEYSVANEKDNVLNFSKSRYSFVMYYQLVSITENIGWYTFMTASKYLVTILLR